MSAQVMDSDRESRKETVVATATLTRDTAPAPNPHYTVEEYLAFERGSESKHEYFAGRILAMVGATEPHNWIVSNIVGELRLQFKGRPCKAYSSTQRVKSPATGLYTYPDICALCGESQLEDSRHDTLLNPVLIAEVLSPSTEDYDRGAKFQHYQQIPSVQVYLLVAQNEYRVEMHLRQPDGRWVYSRYSELTDVVPLAALGCELKLEEIYDKVSLTPQ